MRAVVSFMRSTNCTLLSSTLGNPSILGIMWPTSERTANGCCTTTAGFTRQMSQHSERDISTFTEGCDSVMPFRSSSYEWVMSGFPHGLIFRVPIVITCSQNTRSWGLSTGCTEITGKDARKSSRGRGKSLPSTNRSSSNNLAPRC